MDFRFTDEQELLRESIREWCSRNVDEQKVQEWYAQHGVSDEVAKSWLDAGFGFLGLPEEVGGTPCDNVTLGLVVETLCECTGASMPFATNTFNMYDMCTMGTPEQIEMCMEGFRKTGKPLFSVALSEPGAGSDNMGMTTVAKEIDGKFHITGQKTWVTNGEYDPYVMVVARDEDPARTNTSMSLWLIPLDAPGVSTSPLNKMGNQINPFCEMYFDDVVVDESARVGERGKGFVNLMKHFEIARCMIVATNLGEAQAAMNDAAAYASERIAFEKPISTFQMIQEKLTDMEIRLRNTRNMLYDTLWRFDNNIPVSLECALLKRYGSPATTQVCREAVQIFGGLGYTSETRVGRCMLECMGMEIGGGTSEIMVHVAGRMLAKQYRNK